MRRILMPFRGESKVISPKRSEPSNEPRKLRVAAYCRTSLRTEATSESLQAQARYFMKLTHNNPDWMFAGLFFDSGVSGTQSEKRPGFNRLLKKCAEGAVDRILCKSIPRFSRNAQDCIATINRLKELGVSIWFDVERIDTATLPSAFILTTFAALAEDWSRSRSDSANWSIQNRFQQGTPSLTRVYGYDLKDDRLTINEAEATVVRDMFSLAAEGYCAADIARRVNEKGHKPSRRGRFWSSSTVHYILRNDKYTGDYIGGKYYTSSFLEGKCVTNQGEKPFFLLPDHHPAIISRELFDRVQARVLLKPKPMNKRKRYPFSGILYCGNCGSILHISGASQSPEYDCSTRKALSGSCPFEAIRLPALERALKAAFTTRFDLEKQFVFSKLSMLLDHSIRAALLVPDIKLLNPEQAQSYHKQRDIQDYDYRMKALDWFKQLPSGEAGVVKLLEQLDFEKMRAFITKVVIMAPDRMAIEWLDQTKTNLRFQHDYKRAFTRTVRELKSNFDGPRFQAKTHEPIIFPTLPVESVARPNRPVPILCIPAMPNLRQGFQDVNFKKVCSYCRVSTSSDFQQSSFQLQIEHYSRLIKKNPDWLFCGIYADESSGTTTNGRSNLQRMVEDCQKGRIDLVICKSISRLARNTVDCLDIIRTLKNCNPPVDMYFETENIYISDQSSEVVLSLLASLSQDESRSNSENLKWGRHKRFEQGIVPKNKLCFGYRLDPNGCWVIDERKATIVRRVFGELLAGQPVRDTCRRLQMNGVETVRGKKTWDTNILYFMLRNESYCGDITLNKNVTIDYLSHRKTRNRQIEPMYMIRDHHPAIIPRADWDKAQAILDARCNRKGFVVNPLEKQSHFGKPFICGNCGSMLGSSSSHWKTVNGKTLRRRFLRCRAAMLKRIEPCCDAQSVMVESVESAFMIMLLDMKRQRTKLEADCRQVIEMHALTADETDRMAGLEQQMMALYTTFRQQSESAEILEEIATQIERVKEEWQALDDKRDRLSQMEVELAWLLSELARLPDKDSAKEPIPFSRDIFDRLVVQGSLNLNGDMTYDLSVGISWIATGNFLGKRMRRKPRKQATLR